MTRSILITGVSSGIGAATAGLFLERGWTVLGTVRDRADAEWLIRVGGPRFHTIEIDVTNETAVGGLTQKVAALLDGKVLDVVCNNAGTSVPAATMCQTVENFRSAIELNLIAPFAISRALFPMLRRPGGRILFVGSLAGVDPLPFCAAYSAAKHGIEALAGSLRVELAQTGIDVSVIAPGSTRTAIGSKVGNVADLEGANSEFGPTFQRMAMHMFNEAQSAFDPQQVARIIELAATSSRPKGRYVVTPGYLSNWLVPRMLGPRWQESRWRKRLFA